MNLIRKRLTYANVTSSLAVFLILGGATAFAASQLGKNSVGPKQLRKNAVTTAKIKSNAVTTAKLADGAVIAVKLADGSVLTGKISDASVTTAKIQNDAVTGDKVKESTLGEVPLATNATLLSGKAPTGYLSSTVYKLESLIAAGTTLGDSTQVITQACSPGDILLTGGPANIAATTTLLESSPTPGVANSWSVRVNKNGQVDLYSVAVLCIDQ